MLTSWLRKFFIKWVTTSEKSNFFLEIFFVQNLISWKLFINANIMKTETFHKIKYNFKVHIYVTCQDRRGFVFFLTFRPSGLITTLTLLDSCCPCCTVVTTQLKNLWNYEMSKAINIGRRQEHHRQKYSLIIKNIIDKSTATKFKKVQPNYWQKYNQIIDKSTTTSLIKVQQLHW